MNRQSEGRRNITLAAMLARVAGTMARGHGSTYLQQDPMDFPGLGGGMHHGMSDKFKGDGKKGWHQNAAAKRYRRRQLAKASRKVNYRVARMR